MPAESRSPTRCTRRATADSMTRCARRWRWRRGTRRCCSMRSTPAKRWQASSPTCVRGASPRESARGRTPAAGRDPRPSSMLVSAACHRRRLTLSHRMRRRQRHCRGCRRRQRDSIPSDRRSSPQRQILVKFRVNGRGGVYGNGLSVDPSWGLLWCRLFSVQSHRQQTSGPSNDPHHGEGSRHYGPGSEFLSQAVVLCVVHSRKIAVASQ